MTAPSTPLAVQKLPTGIASFDLISRGGLPERRTTLISGTADHTVPDVVTRSTLKQYRDAMTVNELKQFEGRGHSLTIDHGWAEVADSVLEWLKVQGL